MVALVDAVKNIQVPLKIDENQLDAVDPSNRADKTVVKPGPVTDGVSWRHLPSGLTAGET
jgi:hypothetical protein